VLESFTADTFSGLLGQAFGVRSGQDTTMTMELIAVDEHDRSRREGSGRAPFSLEFRGPAVPILLQAIYTFRHDDLGEFDIFIVPIGPDPEGMRYEAVFG